MMLLLIFLSMCQSWDIGQGKHSFQSLESNDGKKDPNKLSSESISCDAMLTKAISLNESFKNAVSAGGQRAFRLESEHYYSTVLLKNISACVDDTAARPDIHLAKLLFQLADSYSNSADEEIAFELARFYSKDQAMAQIILLEYEKNKRQGLIEMLRWGLDTLYSNKPGEASRLKKFKQSLNELELK
jgi:hypothetical protein